MCSIDEHEKQHPPSFYYGSIGVGNKSTSN